MILTEETISKKFGVCFHELALNSNSGRSSHEFESECGFWTIDVDLISETHEDYVDDSNYTQTFLTGYELELVSLIYYNEDTDYERKCTLLFDRDIK